MPSSSPIDIVPLAAEHRQQVTNLLLSSFFLQEPLNAMLKFDLPREPMPWIDHILDEALHDEYSFVAIDTANTHRNVVGVILNGISRRDSPPDAFVLPSEKLKFIFSLMDKVCADQNLFESFNTDCLIHCDIINIDEHQRGQNLSARLISISLEKARQMGIKGAFVVCSSLFSRKAFMRYGYHVVNEILYSEHGNGRLTDMGIHDRCTLLAKQL